MSVPPSDSERGTPTDAERKLAHLADLMVDVEDRRVAVEWAKENVDHYVFDTVAMYILLYENALASKERKLAAALAAVPVPHSEK